MSTVNHVFTTSDARLPAAGPADDSSSSGVSWGAIFAGAAAAAAMTMILLVLGVGLGFAVASPWNVTAEKAGAFGGAAIAWIVFTQIAASALGGYLAGRLRVKWKDVHTDEVYFRDTAHGLLAWAVATLVTAALIGSAIGSVASGAAQAGGTAAKGAASVMAAGAGGLAAGSGATRDADPSAYFVDTLFRSDAAQPADAGDASMRTEVLRIFANDIRTGTMGPEDVRYVGQLIARRTGIAPADAERRVADAFTKTSTALVNAETKAKQAADEARKAAATASLWMFVALLAAAFCASVAALYGGRQRDMTA